jgi:predicted GIY-YIG superfamily endonuclease
MDNQYVYVLRLEGGFWYVGKTNDLTKRLRQHETCKGSNWTKAHPVVKLHHSKFVSSRSSSGEETRMTAELMIKHGVNKVRGAELTQVADYKLENLEMLTNTIGHALNLNFKEVRKKLKDDLDSKCLNLDS